MAWQYRKRVKVAPGVYMNITKNGISSSIGVRGASITFGKKGTYLNTGIPGTGFYNRQRVGMPSTPKTNYPQPSTPKIHSKGTYTFVGLMCGFVALICLFAAPIGLIGTFVFGLGVWANFSNRKKYYGKNASETETRPSFITDAKKALADATDERQKHILSNFINTIETIDAIEDEEKIIESLKRKPDKNAELISSHSAELDALKKSLADTGYDIDNSVSSQKLRLYEEACNAFEELLTAQKIWIQTSKIQNTEAKAAASSIVNIQETTLGVGVFNYIKSKFDTPIFPFGNQLLYLYPEFAIISQSPTRFEVVDYDDISIVYTTIRFHEPGLYPSDAEKIGSTWEYVNKDGGPDRRYVNNRQVAVVRYGGIIISIKGHQSVTYQVSNAHLADVFCANYNHFASITKSAESIPTINSIPTIPDTTEQSSLADVIRAADKLYQCLIAMSADTQVIKALDNQPQLESARNLQIKNIDNRLALVAALDFIKCFEGLGHKPDMSTDEGRAIGLLFARILVPDNVVWNNEAIVRQPDGQKALEGSYNTFKKHLRIEFDPNRFLLIEILRHEGVDEETVNRWAVLLYRYALLIAKADGYLSDTEQKWLTNILSFTNNDIAKPTNHRSTTIEDTLDDEDDLDPLFEEAARFVVSTNQVSTSMLQRTFKIGYNRSGRIMDQLESAGVVSPFDGRKFRGVLMDSFTLENLLKNIRSKKTETIDEVSSVHTEIDSSDTPKKIKDKTIANPMKELESLIGLSGVKTEISNIYNLVKVQKIRVSKGLTAPDISYHCVFTGNPGTGKTTVARLVAQIYKELGILSKGHLVETDRSGLVAEYVGQTAVKTNKIIDSALDGVLFVDEAYSLVQNGGGNDFGLEAIATLLKRMEDNRDRLVVILAGYSEEMKAFIDSNPGLQSRFNRYINFEDYSPEELTSIYEFNLAKFDYKMTDKAAMAIREVMAKAVENKDKNFGNARFVRNLFEKTLERQAKRLAASSLSSLTEESLTEITETDIRN